MHGITLTKAPADWEILQQENGKATVALKGNFQVHPAAIEVGVERVTPVVRVMSEDDNMTVIPWTNADHFTCNEKFQGEFEVTLEIPAGGLTGLIPAWKQRALFRILHGFIVEIVCSIWE